MAITTDPTTPLTVYDGQEFYSYLRIDATPAGPTRLSSYTITASKTVPDYWSSGVSVSIGADGTSLLISGRYTGSFSNYTVEYREDRLTETTALATSFTAVPEKYWGVYDYEPDTTERMSAYIHIETDKGSADLIQFVRHDWNADRNALIDLIWGGDIAQNWNTDYKPAYLPTPQSIDSSAPFYGVTPNTLSVGEAGTVTFTVSAFNVPDDTVLYWSINHVTTSNADFTTSRGTTIVTAESATFDVETVPDIIPEVDEYFTVSVRTDSFTGSVIATSDQIAVTQPYVIFNLTVSAAYTTSYNVKTQMTAAGWNGADPAIVNLTINTSATIVGGTNTSVAALYVDVLDAAGLSQVNITNYGKILGRGGSGGAGWNVAGNNPVTASSGGEPGGPGGTALYVSSTTRITNYGTIAGGGGGGGAGQAATIFSYYFVGVLDSGGGGGGAPFGARRTPPALGGTGGAYAAGAADVGTLSAGGAGGISQARVTFGYSNLTNIGDGGPGGGWATAGTQGEVTGTFLYVAPVAANARKSGGAAGAAWRGNSFITIVRNGTISGAKL